LPANPNVVFNILNNGLGQLPASPSQAICVFGTSSGGTANTIAGPYTRATNVVADNGYGPGPELTAYLAAAGVTVYFCRLATTANGSNTAVTHTGTGSSVMTVTGTPFDIYNTIVTMTRSGTVGTDPEPGFTVSLDGGLTSSAEIRVPASGTYTGLAATTGLTLVFTAASTIVGDTYMFQSTSPTANSASVTAGVQSLRDDVKTVGIGYVVGAMAASVAAATATVADTFITRKKFIRIIGEARDINTAGSETESAWMTSIENDYATFASDLMGIAATPAIVPSAISGIQYRRGGGGMWAGIKRAGLVKFGRSIGAVEDGALTGITTVFHDEALQPGLTADRFIALTSYPGQIGYYIALPSLMCNPGSDFTELQLGRVMDEVSRTNYAFFVQKLNTDVRVETSGTRKGKILKKDALTLQSGANSAQDAAVVATGNASGVSVLVSLDDNILSTKTLTVLTQVIPLGYIEQILITESFVNPAIGQ
jgi:uncharacterized protein DUF2586